MEKNIAGYVFAAQQGNEEAFEKIFEATRNSVYYTCLGLLKNEADAKDLLQETFITSFQKINTLTEPEKYAAWVHRIAVNKCKDYLVARKAWIVSSDEVEDIEDIPDTDLESIPESFVLSKDKRNVILQIMRDQLSCVQYRTVFLYYFDELSIAEIAALMECSENTVKSRLHLAKAKLKEGITMHEEEEKSKLFIAVPFLSRFFRAEASEVTVPPVEMNLHETAKIRADQARSGNSADTAMQPDKTAPAQNDTNTIRASTTSIKAGGIFASTGTKILAAAICAAFVIGGIVLGIQLTSKVEQAAPTATGILAPSYMAEYEESGNAAGTSDNVPASAMTEVGIDNETSAKTAEAGIYEGNDLKFYEELRDAGYTILDIERSHYGLSVLTSDHRVGRLYGLFSFSLIHNQQVSEDAVGLLLSENYCVLNADGSYSVYEDVSLSSDAEEVEADHGKSFSDIAVSSIKGIGSTYDGVPYILYLDGTTLKYTDSTEDFDETVYIKPDTEDYYFSPVIDAYYASGSMYILLENHTLEFTTGFPGVGETLNHEEGGSEMLFAAGVQKFTRLPDVEKVFTVGTFGHYPEEIVYQKVGDTASVYFYSNLIEDLQFSVTLPDGYTTDDIKRIVTSNADALFEFTDGTIYLIKSEKKTELFKSEELTTLNQAGHILDISGFEYINIIMDDQYLYYLDT